MPRNKISNFHHVDWELIKIPFYIIIYLGSVTSGWLPLTTHSCLCKLVHIHIVPQGRDCIFLIKNKNK